MGHWTPTGIEPRAYDDVLCYDSMCLRLLAFRTHDIPSFLTRTYRSPVFKQDWRFWSCQSIIQLVSRSISHPSIPDYHRMQSVAVSVPKGNRWRHFKNRGTTGRYLTSKGMSYNNNYNLSQRLQECPHKLEQATHRANSNTPLSADDMVDPLKLIKWLWLRFF